MNEALDQYTADAGYMEMIHQQPVIHNLKNEWMATVVLSEALIYSAESQCFIIYRP